MNIGYYLKTGFSFGLGYMKEIKLESISVTVTCDCAENFFNSVTVTGNQ